MIAFTGSAVVPAAPRTAGSTDGGHTPTGANPANLVDDVEHCLKADTSPHLVEQLTGSRDFLLGTLDDVMTRRVMVPDDRPVIFSPFGLGVLDLAVGRFVHDEVARAGDLHVVDDFFTELSRYG